MTKTHRIINRLIMFLPFAIIHLIAALTNYCWIIGRYCKYGGETIVYEKGTQKNVQDIYFLLEDCFDRIEE